MPTVSVVVPFLNEEETLRAFCGFIEQKAEAAPYDVEVIFVDDGSTDDSIRIIESYGFNHCSHVRVISFSKNFGSHAAIRAGISKSTGNYCTFIGADLEEPEDMLDVMYEKITEGHDAVYIEKKSVAIGAVTRLTSNIYSALMRKYAVSNYRKGGVNNIMFSRKIADYLNGNIETNSSVPLQILDAGFDSVLVGMDYRTRVGGRSKWTLSKKIKLFIDSFVGFSYMPIRAVSIVGALFAAVGIIYGIYVIIARLLHPGMQQGYATMIVLLLFGFGITNISLGVIAEYLWRTFDAARNRPAFIISQEINIK
ncbi:MAG: glycosyltransferase [Clostridiales Family XIII bacterium]|nr:glycosyltransferase [Clostridiales Family XIII bacterium]